MRLATYLMNRRSLPLLILLAIVLLAQHRAILGFYQVWLQENNPTYSHGPLLLLVAAFVFLQRLRTLKPMPSFRLHLAGSLPLVAFGFIALLAGIGSVQVVQQLALIATLLAVIWAGYGFSVMRRLAFPFILLLAAVPIWDFLTPYLRLTAVYTVPWLMGLTGFSALAEGYNILVPAGVFSVDTGCSGLNQFVVALALGMLYSAIHRLDYKFALLALAVALFSALAANIARIYIVVLSGQLTAMQHYFVTTDHVVLGWVVFAVFIAAYFAVMEKYVLPRNTLQISEQFQPDPANEPGFGKYHLVGLAVVFVLASLPLVQGSLQAQGPAPQVAFLPKQLQSWNRTQEAAFWQPFIEGADAYRSAVYRSDSVMLQWHSYHYWQQSQGKEAVSDNHRLAGTHGHLLHSQDFVWQWEQRPLAVKESQVQTVTGEKLLVWSWYQIGAHTTASPYTAKMRNIWRILQGRPAIAVYALAVPLYGGEVASARVHLQRFWRAANSIFTQDTGN